MHMFFFFKQKTAYEMRISDWSSDVCSSDLLVGELVGEIGRDVGDQRRHMVGDQANPALALAQRLGMAVALGDVSEGIDEAAGGQRMGANFQHAAIEQELLKLADRPAAGVTAVGCEQGQDRKSTRLKSSH